MTNPRPTSIHLLLLAALAGPSLAGTLASDEFAAPSLDALVLQAPQALPEEVGTPRDPSERAAEMRTLQQRLLATQVQQATRRPLVVELGRAERAKIDDTNRVERKYLVGVAKQVMRSIDFSAARRLDSRTAALDVGAARGNGGGAFTWTASVKVSGATALRLHITDLDLPAGAALYVYNRAGQAFGPYAGRGPLGDGELHTNTVFGDELIVQLDAPGGEARTPRLTLAEVGVMGRRFAAPRYGPKGAFAESHAGAIFAEASNLCSRNADCVINAACQSTAVVNDAKDAVASILFQSGASFYICTGGLIADTDTGTVVPFFLTAHHCISSSGEASSLETYFDYQTTCNSPNCTQPYNNAGDTLGSTIKATGSTSDYSLLQLASTPVTADGVTRYLGWLSTPVANTNNTALYRISHPAGSPQAYSEQVVDTSKPTCRTLPRGDFIYSRDTLGATEGGSSGSPVVNGASQIVGQLYGACGFNLNDVCDSASNATVDGAFAASYPNLAAFLNPGSGGCSAKGAACTSDAQCCSNRCRGKAGAQTCK